MPPRPAGLAHAPRGGRLDHRGVIPSFASIEDNIPHGGALAVGGVAWAGAKIGGRYGLGGAMVLSKVSTIGTAATVVATGLQLTQLFVC